MPVPGVEFIPNLSEIKYMTRIIAPIGKVRSKFIQKGFGEKNILD
jgi:hypothetical protein